MKPFIFGFQPTVDDSPFDDIATVYAKVGDNTGNLAFCYAASRALGHGLRSILWHADPQAINAMGDIGVLTLANQLGPHVDMGYLVDGFRKLEVSLVGLGLGAQAGTAQDSVEVPQGTLDWVRCIQDRSPKGRANIGVRGEFSLKVLERYGLGERATVTGCPTLFLSPAKNLGKDIRDRFDAGIHRIAVTGGHQRWMHLARLEASLVAISQGSAGAYVCQSPIEMVQMGRGELHRLSREVRDACRAYIAPTMSDDDFVEWSRRCAVSFFSAPAWMEYMRRFDFVVGTRIHGVMLALQAGVPALCFAHDSRTVELCQTMAVPYVKAQDFPHGVTRDQLLALFDFDPAHFDSNRKMRARNFVAFLRDNELSPVAYLQTLAAE